MYFIYNFAKDKVIKIERRMKERLKFLIKVYIWFIAFFVLLKPIFMLKHFNLYSETPISEWFKIITKGFSMDIAIASYIIAPIIIFLIISVWIKGKWIKYTNNIYLGIITTLVSLVAIVDLGLYSYWGFRIDATPIFYLANPSEALASAKPLELIIVTIAVIAIFFILYIPLRRFNKKSNEWNKCKHPIVSTAVLILIGGFVFIGIRGGIGTSTMNIGRAFYSTEIKYNHAAVNPIFSLLYSLTHQNNFGDYARFMNDEEADEIFKNIFSENIYIPTDDESWLRDRKPNIVLIILEGFSKGALTNNGVEIAPNMLKLIREGVSFNNIYANSFRTDRGLFAVVDGFPALPTTSVMKYPDKMVTFPSLINAIKEQGYETSFLYGGDANFTNMRSFFATGGCDEFITDVELNVSRIESKWGANDHITFDYLKNDILNYKKEKPFLKTFLTLSSHEPFEVPFKKFENPYLNSVAYTDSCLGDFIDKIKLTEVWNKTLFVLIPDHGVSYLLGYNDRGKESHSIPMVWCGGAIKEAKEIDKYTSQSDMASTLLAQLGIDYSKFKYSRNIADTTLTNFAYWTFPNGFAMANDSNFVIYDCDANTATTLEGDENEQLLQQGKAILQKLYDRIK